MRQVDAGVVECSGISWTICKQSAPCCRQITTPTPHHSIFTGWMLFLMPNQQCYNTKGTILQYATFTLIAVTYLLQIDAVNSIYNLLSLLLLLWKGDAHHAHKLSLQISH